MPVCTFFGHRECPETIKPHLLHTLRDLIVNHGVDLFYVGNQGQFDAFVRSALRELAKQYPHIRYAVVLAYMPGTANEYGDHSNTMLPEGIEAVHPRYAISWRNNWMLQQSDYVVAYVTHTWGGTARFTGQAKRQRKEVIFLPDPAKHAAIVCQLSL